MKRVALGSFAVLGILAIACAGIAAFRPDLVPGWAHIGPAQRADAGPYCEEHGVPEKFCTLCHPELKEKLLLCPEHGNIPEDICTLCHKDVQKKYNIKMCPNGHGLPEHFCIKCGNGPSAAAENLIDDGYCAATRRTSWGRTESRNSASYSRWSASLRRTSAATSAFRRRRQPKSSTPMS